ncbi:MAG: hypothetical protein V4658_07010 [Bacteroidota bacterium]
MNKKLILKLTGALAGILVILFIVLVVHVGKVTIARKNDKRNRQLSRIDFKEDINSEQAAKIKGYVASLDGVCGVNMNTGSDILTYMFDPSKQSSENVFTQLIKATNHKAERYVVNNADIAKGCPAFAEKVGLSKAVLYCANILYN